MSNRTHKKHRKLAARFISVAVVVSVILVPLIVSCFAFNPDLQRQDNVFPDADGQGEHVVVPMESTTTLNVQVLTNSGEYTGQPVYPTFRFTNSAGQEVKLIQGTDYDVEPLYVTDDLVNVTDTGYGWSLWPADGSSYNFYAYGNFQILPKTVNFTAENLQQTIGGTATVKPVNVSLTEGQDYKVEYWPWDEERGQYVESLSTQKPVTQGRYKVAIRMLTRNYQVGTVNGTTQDVELVVDVRRYKFTFDYNNDELGVEVKTPEWVSSGIRFDAFKPATPSVQGKKLQYWYRIVDGIEFRMNDNNIVSEDVVTFYAKWDDSDDATLRTLQATSGGKTFGFTESDYTTPLAYDADNTLYHLQVENAVAQLTLNIVPSDQDATIEVQVGGKTVTAGSDGTWTVPLSVVSVSQQSNLVQVRVIAPDRQTSKTYTLRVQRLHAVEFSLGYGNSPYGCIMRENNDSAKQASEKERFRTTRIYKGVRYSEQAWNDMGVDYDLNETALFVGQKETVQDAAVSISDSMGNPVAASEIHWELKLKTFPGGVPTTAALSSASTVTLQGLGNQNIQMPNAFVVPGVYDIEYSYTDRYLGEVTGIRKCIVTGANGDVNLDGRVNDDDVSAIEESILFMNTQAPSLYRYRIVDVCSDENEVINLADSAQIERSANGLAKYYPAVS